MAEDFLVKAATFDVYSKDAIHCLQTIILAERKIHEGNSALRIGDSESELLSLSILGKLANRADTAGQLFKIGGAASGEGSDDLDLAREYDKYVPGALSTSVSS